jgi:hypothetical protein
MKTGLSANFLPGSKHSNKRRGYGSKPATGGGLGFSVGDIGSMGINMEQ